MARVSAPEDQKVSFNFNFIADICAMYVNLSKRNEGLTRLNDEYALGMQAIHNLQEENSIFRERIKDLKSKMRKMLKLLIWLRQLLKTKLRN